MIRVAEPLTGLAHDLLEQRTALPIEGDDARSSGVAGAQVDGRRGRLFWMVIPRSAWFSVNRRFNAEEELDEELARADRHRSPRARPEMRGAELPEVDVLQRAPSAGADEDSRRRRGRSPTASSRSRAPRREWELCPGTLEIRWYAQLGIPAFAYGGGRLDVSHGPDEFIDEAAMRRCAAVYALFAGRA